MTYQARRTSYFTESVIREMTRVAHRHGAINLAQGFPDFPASQVLKDLAGYFINSDYNQYPVTYGEPELRRALEDNYLMKYGLRYGAEDAITVCCGATEAMMASLLAVVDPGDEVIIFEPFYENYWADTVISGAVPRFVRLLQPGWEIDCEALEKAFNPRTRAIIINTPHNPTGKVFSREELTFIAGLCKKYDALTITDEIYENILYEGCHIPMAALDGMYDRTITISGFSKTFAVTGWRLGYALAPAGITGGIRKMHDFLTVGAPTPLQRAAARYLDQASGKIAGLSEFYRPKRDMMVNGLKEIGFDCGPVRGAYYIMAGFADLSDSDDHGFAVGLTSRAGVACVPGTSFYSPGKPDGKKIVRFCFCKEDHTLEEALERLKKHFLKYG